MRQSLFLIVVLLTVLTGCGTTNPPILSEGPAVRQTSAATPPLQTPTTSGLTTTMPVPTDTPSPVATRLPTASLTEKGLLLLWDGVESYLVIDLDEGTIHPGAPWGSDCKEEVIPRSTRLVCRNTTGHYYLFDVLSGSRQDLTVAEGEMVGWSPNGRFLTFSRTTEAGETVFAYEIATGETYSLAIDLNPQEQFWLVPPVLSADGQSLLVARHYAAWVSRVFEIVPGTSQYRQVGLDQPFSTGDVAWSPTSDQFVYGATDIEQEVAPFPNYLYIGDMQTGIKRQLAKSPNARFYWPGSLEWSPTGRQVAVGLWDLLIRSEPNACVLDIDTSEQTCLPARRGMDGRFLAWSPSGEYIAFADVEGNLNVANREGDILVELLEDVNRDFMLFWR